MKKMLFSIIWIFNCIVGLANEGHKNTANTLLSAVTVYRTGAEMNHIAKASLIKGNNELFIENISNALEVNSIQVSCNASVTVMGTEFSTDNLQEEIKTPFVKKLEDSLDKVDKEVEKNKISIDIVNDLIAVLKVNREIKGTQTGLSVAELVRMMDYYKVKSIELQNELGALNQKQSKLNEVLERLNLQIEEEQKKNTKASGRLILQLNCAIAGNYEFTITYVTPNAFWTPFYDLRADNIKSPVKLIYRAKIFQTTGIDWKQVKLSLSTSTPTLGGNAPVFKAWFLSYINPVNYYDKSLSVNHMNTINNALAGKVAGTQLRGESFVHLGKPGNITLRGLSNNGNDKIIYVVNGIIMSSEEAQKIDINEIKDITVLDRSKGEALFGAQGMNGAVLVTTNPGFEDYISISNKELNVTFEIELPYDVPTNGKAQTAVLKEYDVPATYKFYSVPKLDKDVFLLAQIADWEKLNLLPGEANIIFEGTYIGKSFIDPSSTQDTLNLTMGRDKRVIVKREKLVDYSSVKFLGTNKKQIFTYEITVRNNKKDSINILIKDQYPISQNKEVDVELLESGNAVVNEDIGVLNWKISLAPGETRKLRISYSVKYPKDKVLNLN